MELIMPFDIKIENFNEELITRRLSMTRKVTEEEKRQ
jgi:hypothetical protein